MNQENWRTSTVVAIARQMRQSNEFFALPILADAMEEGGFGDIGVLYSARNDPNAGNWIVALCLNEIEESRKWMQSYAEEINSDARKHTEEFGEQVGWWYGENRGTEVTVEILIEVAKKSHETGETVLGFGFDIPYGESWMTAEKLDDFRKHSEILLKATLHIKEGEWFHPFRCGC